MGRASRSRAMPVGDRRSLGRRRWGGFRAPARCRSETGAPGAALLGRVSRSRAMPVGDRRSTGRRRWGGFRAHARCRSETGAPGAASLGRVSRSRAMPVGDRRSVRRWCGFRAPARCRSEDRRSWASLRFNANFRARKKQMAANLWFAAGDFGGMCERGDSPLSQLVTTNRNSPKCASGARGSFDCGAKRRAVRKGGSPPTRPHLVSLPGSDAPLPNRSFAAVMKRGHWGVSGLFGGSQTLSTSCQASASGTPFLRVR